MGEQIFFKDTFISFLQEAQFTCENNYTMKINGWEKIYYMKNKDKKDGVAILAPDKLDFKIKSITRNKEGYFIIKVVSSLGRYNYNR